MIKTNIKKFTLIELITAMAIFSILMVVMMKFFNEAQEAWTKTAQRSLVYDNARIAMDIITRDLQCIIYTENNAVVDNSLYPFWHEDTDKINFITVTNLKPSNATSGTCEVKYARSDGDLTDNDDISGTAMDAGWLVRAATGDNDLTKYNYASFDRNTYPTDRVYKIWKKAGAVISSENFEKIIPYVVELKFTCYGLNGSSDFIDMSTATYTLPNSGPSAKTTPLPFCIQVDLTLMDKTSWEKWKALVGTANWASYIKDPDGNEPSGSNSRNFREKTQRKFTKLIYLGNRNI